VIADDYKPTWAATFAAFEPMTPEQREALTAYLNEGSLDHETRCIALFGQDFEKRVAVSLLSAIL
jgi:hypothetical protein